MAEGTGGSSDWTAGIVAIVAALLLGGGIPIGLYFGLYQPKVKEREAAEQKLTELQDSYDLLLIQKKDVEKLQDEADDMANRLRDIEEDFASSSGTEGSSIAVAQFTLEQAAKDHDLSLRQEISRSREVYMVNPAGEGVEFEQGLKTARFSLEAQARFHDFGRFMAHLESREDYIIVVEDLLCQGDANQGTEHVFVMHFHIIQKRNIDEIGT